MSSETNSAPTVYENLGKLKKRKNINIKYFERKLSSHNARVNIPLKPKIKINSNRVPKLPPKGNVFV